MRDWKTFWNSIDTQKGKNNDWLSMMTQVGKTIQRKPIDDDQFKKTYEKIVNVLLLEKNDTVLDLCCGNGVVTTKIAEYVGAIIGVDFSQPLIDVANTTKPNNVNYFCTSVLDTSLAEMLENRKFKKFYMNTALQHFSESDFDKLLDNFLSLSASESVFLLLIFPKKRIYLLFMTVKNDVKIITKE